MDRKEEYRLLMEELEDSPVKLEYTMQRVEARRKNRGWRRFVAIPVSSCLVVLMVFTMLVNYVPVFAYTCGSIPVIKELAQLVAFSPSLSAAVENRYVQVIEQEQTINEITARIEYVIVDQKQLNIVYSLDSEKYTAIYAEPSIRSLDGTSLQGYGLSSGRSDVENGQLNYITVDFIDEEMPSGLALTLKVRDNGSWEKTEVVEESMLSTNELTQHTYEEPEFISEFTFDLVFDPYYTAQGEQIEMNESLKIDGQTLILKSAEIYPTHMSFTFDDTADNTAWLKGLDFYIMNEKGKKFEKIANGITATGKTDSPMMATHRLESSFFSQSKELTLYITGVEWLDKEREKVKLDLQKIEAEYLPEGVSFHSAERKNNGWLLTFLGKQYEEGASYQIWNSDYYDEAGKAYTFNSWSSHTGSYWDEKQDKYIESWEVFSVEIPLINYIEDTVYMSPIFTRRVELSKPVVIKIK